jgi:hypothetical protein
MEKNILECDLQLGFLLKKNICGKKSLLKSFNLGLVGEEESDDDDIENEKKDPSKLDEDKEIFKIRWKRDKRINKPEKKKTLEESGKVAPETEENNKSEKKPRKKREKKEGVTEVPRDANGEVIKKKRGRKPKIENKDKMDTKQEDIKHLNEPSSYSLLEADDKPNEKLEQSAEKIEEEVTEAGEKASTIGKGEEDVKVEEPKREDDQIIFSHHFDRAAQSTKSASQTPKKDESDQIMIPSNSNSISTAVPTQGSPSMTASFGPSDERPEMLRSPEKGEEKIENSKGNNKIIFWQIIIYWG